MKEKTSNVLNRIAMTIADLGINVLTILLSIGLLIRISDWNRGNFFDIADETKTFIDVMIIILFILLFIFYYIKNGINRKN